MYSFLSVHLDWLFTPNISKRVELNARLYSKTCVRQPPLKLTLVVDAERWLSYKGTCHVILLAKLHDMYLYKTDNFFHINHYLKSVSKVALLHRFYCIFKEILTFKASFHIVPDDILKYLFLLLRKKMV